MFNTKEIELINEAVEKTSRPLMEDKGSITKGELKEIEKELDLFKKSLGDAEDRLRKFMTKTKRKHRLFIEEIHDEDFSDDIAEAIKRAGNLNYNGLVDAAEDFQYPVK